MKKAVLPALGLCALLTSSCYNVGTADGTAVTPTLVGRWQLDNYSIRTFRNGQTTSQQLVTRDSLTTCQQDDYAQYNADYSGLDYLGQRCAGETSTQIAFRWELNGSNQLIKTYADSSREGMTISVMTEGYYTALDTLYPTTSRPDTGVLLQQYKRLN